MWNIWTITLAFIAVNLVTVALFWVDKQAAIKRQYRISEKTLLIFALIGGTPGAFFAQQRFRHKTQKEPFRTLLILIAFLQVALIALYTIKPDLVIDFLKEIRI